MISRRYQPRVIRSLDETPAVVILGPRQIGKTNLAREVAATVPGSVYLDLEEPGHAARLADPARYIEAHAGTLMVIDQVQRMPGLFDVLRGQIDARRRMGQRVRQFLLLSSASRTLLNQSAESLAGRLAYYELPGLDAQEVEAAHGGDDRDRLWLRGGFPDSFTAPSDGASVRWRLAFIRTYLEREVPQFGVRVPAATLRRFWTMLAHRQGGLLNASALAQSLGVSPPTASRYLDLLVDLMLVRRLPPYFANVGKRLVKAPKVYIRDTGILHALLGLRTRDDLLSHPVAGPSWEGFVIENLRAVAPFGTDAWFYRTRAGAEIDLLLMLPDQRLWAVEVKRGEAPKTSKGFELAANDLEVAERFVVYPGDAAYPLSENTSAVPLSALMARLAKAGWP